jgi:hypothetical protein
MSSREGTKIKELSYTGFAIKDEISKLAKLPTKEK